MVAELTEYLFKYKAVAIPGIGTLTIQRTGPVLEKTEALCTAPAYKVQFSKEDAVPAQQQATLAADIACFGRRLKKHIDRQPFTWKGIGLFSREQGEIIFNPEIIQVPYLQTVAAQAVVRADAAHKVLVGEQEFTSAQMAESLAFPQKKKSWLWIGWIVLALALALAAYILYRGHFSPTAAGLQNGKLIFNG